MSAIRAKLIENGVRNLKEFGYPSVDTKNILTDGVFKQFFVSMLKDNLGQGFDTEINALLSELAGKTKP
jgi:hypothetical protein